MGKAIPVTPAQVKAAQIRLARIRARGETPPAKLVKIAEARRGVAEAVETVTDQTTDVNRAQQSLAEAQTEAAALIATQKSTMQSERDKMIAELKADIARSSTELAVKVVDEVEQLGHDPASTIAILESLWNAPPASVHTIDERFHGEAVKLLTLVPTERRQGVLGFTNAQLIIWLELQLKTMEAMRRNSDVQRIRAQLSEIRDAEASGTTWIQQTPT